MSATWYSFNATSQDPRPATFLVQFPDSKCGRKRIDFECFCSRVKMRTDGRSGQFRDAAESCRDHLMHVFPVDQLELWKRLPSAETPE